MSRDKLQRHRAAEPIQTANDIFEALGFNELVEPVIKVKMPTSFHEVFKLYARIVNPEEGGEKFYAFFVHRLLRSMCCTWAELYSTLATSRKEVLSNKYLLDQEIQKLTDKKDGRVKKLAGELDVFWKKHREVQDALDDR